MQITHSNTPPTTSRPSYRERLTPSLWTLVAAAAVAPMAALVFTPIDSTLALAIGLGAGLGLMGLLVGLSPTVAVDDGVLRAGRAHIDVHLLGAPTALTAEDARSARGTALDPRGWHLIRGGIDGILVVPVTDPDDPVTVWTISSRTPDRLAAAIVRAQATRRTPGR